MSRGVLRSRVQRHLVVLSGEVRVKVDRVTVKNRRLRYFVAKLEVHRLQICQRARFEVKLLLKRQRRKALRGVVRVEDRLLELLLDSPLVEAGNIDAVEVRVAPKLTLLQLLVVDCLV